jgi:hypothetical protein
VYLIEKNVKRQPSKTLHPLGQSRQTKEWLLDIVYNRNSKLRQGPFPFQLVLSPEETISAVSFLSRVLYRLNQREQKEEFDDDLIDTLTIILCLQRRILADELRRSSRHDVYAAKWAT